MNWSSGIQWRSAPTLGELGTRRWRRKFVWWPTRCGGNITVWLGWVEVQEEIVERYVSDNVGSAWPDGQKWRQVGLASSVLTLRSTIDYRHTPQTPPRSV